MLARESRQLQPIQQQPSSRPHHQPVRNHQLINTPAVASLMNPPSSVRSAGDKHCQPARRGATKVKEPAIQNGTSYPEEGVVLVRPQLRAVRAADDSTVRRREAGMRMKVPVRAPNITIHNAMITGFINKRHGLTAPRRTVTITSEHEQHDPEPPSGRIIYLVSDTCDPVRKADPSRLVFIDNAGRPQQSTNNLNFRLIEGIDEFPEKAVSVLQSGCLESLLLRSLYTDREFWDSQGGVSGLRPLIHMMEQRGKILLQHIRDRKLQLKRDL
ncbi:protein FAM198A isoform X1 [Lates japonicus]|uniref:Protein FAM198A isoform X1 n=1 Tax=Lates japonicus TaxID=270547 RepID=A0AAD3NG86_LATJO|nr:protein FAM198A isoform X1 [Lates japonicus]